MKLDVNALGTFHQMAREGAGLAAGRLTRMTEVDTRVGITKLNFMRGDDIHSELGDGRQRVGVLVELEGAIEGHSIIIFDRDSVITVLNTLVPGQSVDSFDELSQSALIELGQILNNGFIDGWADVLGTAIDVSTPEFVEGSSADSLIGDLPTAPGPDDLALLFRSQIEATDTEVSFQHYLFPEHDSMATVLEHLREEDGGIDYDKLVGFDRLAQRGANEVASNINTLTGFETSIDIRRLNFVPMSAIPEELANEELIGVAFEFEGMPSGYLVFLFDEESAKTAIDGMVPTTPDDPFGQMGKSAIQELGNIMASGFLDGWANVLDSNIDHSTPEYIHDMGAAAIDPIVIQLGENQEFAFVFDTKVQADNREFDCEILAIPDEDDLERALNQLEIDRIEDEPIEAEFPVDEVEQT
jgi:chemotaxis protein CheC